MAIFRINKNKDYTTMSNFHLRDRNLSLKAKGLLSLMLSLPEDWDYSVKGLEQICKETKDTINGILNELEENGYLTRKRIYTNGKISDWEYNIYENNDLHPKKQDIEKQDIVFYDDNKLLNNKLLNNKESNISKDILPKKVIFTPPTLEEVQEYCRERNSSVDPKTFYEYFAAGNWIDSKGNKVKNWKQKIITWEKQENSFNSKKPIQKQVPNWFDKEITVKPINIDEDDDLKSFVNSFKDLGGFCD